MKSSICIALGLALAAWALPSRRAAFDLQNGLDAIALNNKFKTLTIGTACKTGEQACVNRELALCDNGKFVLQGCGTGESCSALPLVNAPGTSIACATQADIDFRIAATGAKADPGSSSSGLSSSATATSATISAAATASSTASISNSTKNAATTAGNNKDLQKSFTLDPSVIAVGFQNDGQSIQTAGQVASLPSGNNFINFCATVPQLPITNGKQIATGSCNPAPMGVIPSTANMPSAKFTFPQNLGKVPANKAFTVSLAIANMETGHFVNAQQNYFSAPQQLNAQGQIIGHSHVVIEQLSSFKQDTPTDPNKFAFFKGLNDAAVKGILKADVTNGLPAGSYKISTINTAANHQPVLVPVAQHGSVDDVVYFTVA